MNISVVILCRNNRAALAQTLRAALNQTLAPAEILVVETAAGAAECIARFQAPVRLVRAPQSDGNAARNAGAAAAGGDAFMFLDAGDLLAPNVLAELSAALRKSPEGAACCAWRRWEHVQPAWRSRLSSCPPRGAFESPLAAALGGWLQPPCSVLWSRAAFARSGGWESGAGANTESDILTRALAQGVRLVFTDKALAYCRRSINRSRGPNPDRAKLEARLATLRRLSGTIGRRGRAAQSLARALEDLSERSLSFPDLFRECRMLARNCGGPPWRRELANALHDADVALANALRYWRAATARKPALRPVQIVERPADADAFEAARHAGCCVSVVMPTYNSVATLRRAIDSVLMQSFQDFELIVVDDGSTDSTPLLIQAYASPRLRYLRQQNKGVAAARNLGMRQARGEFIAFLDSDDEWSRDKLMLQVGLFRRSHPRVGLTYTGVVNMDGDRVRNIHTPHHRGYLYPVMLQRNVLHGTSGIMIRRCVPDTVGEFDETLRAISDYEYWLRVSQFYFIDYAPEPLMRYYDPAGAPGKQDRIRLSRDFAANQTSRRLLYERYRHDMRAAGVEHRFLISSIRRQLNSPQGSPAAAFAFARQAIAARPLSLEPYAWAGLALAPAAARSALRKLARGFAHEQTPALAPHHA